MEKCIEHFSHEHPLCSFQVDADEDPKPYRCCICGLPILSTPSYTCSINATDCNFFVHKPCTQLPEFFYHPLHLQNVYLTKPKLSLNETSRVGDSTFQNFSYKFGENSNELDLHPLVEKPVEIKSRHRSHIAHPLEVFCKEIVCRCDVCGKEEKGFFFYCKECGFFIHQDCTILPSVVKLPSHPHPFILTYSIPYSPTNVYSQGRNKCSICGKDWRLPDGGVYFCGDCYSLAHVDCAKQRMENVADTEILHFPDEEDAFPRSAIRRFVERNPSGIMNIIAEKKMMTKYHRHPLILEDADDNAVCDVCIQPINMSTSFYGCEDCHFLAHPICASLLPDSFPLFLGPAHTTAELLHGDQMEEAFFNSVFPCSLCGLPSNGFSYKTEDMFSVLCWDVECAVAPKIVKHASHKQHILFQTGGRWISETKLSCCPSESYASDIYRCVVCDYSIHIRCALLPKTTPHKFDDHPLELIMKQHKLQEVFCEVCEQEIELKWWYYGCHECHHYFHVNCIPSVGFLYKVKFGKTLVDSKLHHHPLTLTQMLIHQRHERCGICKKIIKGYSDDQMALHCSPCDFWLHFSCAAATTRLIDYSKILENWAIKYPS